MPFRWCYSVVFAGSQPSFCITPQRAIRSISLESPHQFPTCHGGGLTIIEPLAVRVASVHELGHYAFRLGWTF